ncbi:ribonuclease toxin immunity protein CdiI [Proteus terrae]
MEEDTVIVDENTFYHYVRLAGERYLKLHPENKEIIDSLLLKMPV